MSCATKKTTFFNLSDEVVKISDLPGQLARFMPKRVATYEKYRKLFPTAGVSLWYDFAP